MNVVVCVRQGRDGELGPFDAAAYEAALQLPGAAVTLLSMGPPKTADFLRQLCRLGASGAVLLSDTAFAGADTLATAYTLSLAINRLAPALVLCGRQTLEGDTGQVGPMLAQLTGRTLVTGVTALTAAGGGVFAQTLEKNGVQAAFPALLTLERTYTLRLPSIRSKPGEVQVWDAAALDADRDRCGLRGSPTRVLESRENAAGRRKCTFISPAQLSALLKTAAAAQPQASAAVRAASPLSCVAIVGEAPRAFAETVAETVLPLPPGDADALAEAIRCCGADAVLWGSDPVSKRTAAAVAAKLSLGLCADCTALETDGRELFMIRPALSGSVIAKIRALTRPALATVRTVTAAKRVVVAAGFGVREELESVRAFAAAYDAELAATRRMVDEGLLPYAAQVGLTGRTVAPPVYVAVGVSGAVHHIVGMQRAGTVIAVNPDRRAPVFEYADYGIAAPFSAVFV